MAAPPQKGKVNPFTGGAAGGISAVGARLCIAPVERVKIRVQVPTVHP